MADALCGPSNPLQNLQKHTQVDRTLQQDRLVGARQQFNQVLPFAPNEYNIMTDNRPEFPHSRPPHWFARC